MSSEVTGVSGLASRYANALFELASQQNALDSVATDLGALEGMIEKNADFDRMLHSPVLSRKDQGRAVGAVATQAGLSTLAIHFLGLLAKKRRLFALPAVIGAFRKLLAASRGEVTADVTSAQILNEDQLSAIRRALKQAVGSDVSIRTRVDASLLGGLVVQIGSRMADNSLRSQLERLKIAMKGSA